MKYNDRFKLFSLGVTWSWLIIFAFLPFCLVGIASFLNHNDDHLLQLPFTFTNYIQLHHVIYLKIFKESLYLAAVCTIICLILGYPFAYLLAQIKGRLKNFLVLLLIIPFWTSSLIRTYSMIAILKPKGIMSAFLLWAGIIHKPLALLYTNTAVMIGLIYNLLPFMIIPLLTNIERLDNRLIDAARDLGANRLTTFRKIILPLTMPGIWSGCILVFLPAMTLFYIPDLLGGSKSILLGNMIQNQFLTVQNWPFGSAINVIFTIILMVLLLIYWHSTRGKEHRKLL